jgi:hypothetical protein
MVCKDRSRVCPGSPGVFLPVPDLNPICAMGRDGTGRYVRRVPIFVLANGIFATAPSTECKTKALTFMDKEPLGFQVSCNNALKRITAQLPALRKALLSDRLLESAALAAVQMPIVLDVGAAAFGPPEYYTGSDSLLVLKVSDVAVSEHAF